MKTDIVLRSGNWIFPDAGIFEYEEFVVVMPRYANSEEL